jgi:hypothetical protein
MATLTNPINAQNIVDRFADYVTATANSGISWGTNAVPFGEMDTAYFGGDTGGRGISISGGNVSNTPITASTIYDTLCAETQTYSNIRNLQAVLNVTGGGGNSGSRPTAGVVYDATAVAHLNTGYRQGQINATNPSVSSGNAISASNLETLFDRLRSIYSSNYRATTAYIQIDVCHASCHSNCHGSRGRR